MSDNATTTVPKHGIHHLKCWPSTFQLTRRGDKSFEVRLDDRGYLVGDKIVMHEWDPELGRDREAEGYTGCNVEGTITCIVSNSNSQGVREGASGAVICSNTSGIKDGYVVLGVVWKGCTPQATRGT